MSALLRSAARAALERPRVLGVVALALTLELVARVAVGVVANPYVAVLLPPVLGVPLLAAAFPAVRSAARGDDPHWSAVGRRLRTRARPLLAFAVVGHLAALAVGAGAFLVCDTAVRFALYAAVGEHLPGGPPVGLPALLPLLGVAPAALVAWGLLPPAVLPILDGEGLRAGFETALTAAAESPRRTVLVLAAHLVAAAATLGATLTGLAFAGGVPALAGAAYGGDGRSFALALVAAGGLALLAGTVLFHFAYAVHAASPVARRTGRRRGVPVARVAVAALLCVSLVAGASAVRLTETRPVDAAPDALPDDPTAAYAAAVDNTERANHAFAVRIATPDENWTTVRRLELDRRSREYVSELYSRTPNRSTRSTLYGAPGVVASRFGPSDASASGATAFDDVESSPGYWTVTGAPDYAVAGGGAFTLPGPDSGEWTATNRSGDRLTLALTDADAVFAAVYGVESPPDSVAVPRARLRMTVDTERGVVTGGRATVVRREAGDDAAVAGERTTTFRYEATVDEAVDRPAGLGSPTISEWAWRLFAY